MANNKVQVWWDTGSGSDCTSKGRSWQLLPALPSSVLLFLKKRVILHPHPQTLPPATSIELVQNTVRNHKKKAGQMFSCTRVSGWERQVAVALVGGGPQGSVCPQCVFWGEDAALGFFSFQRYCWTRLKACKCPITHRIAFFPLILLAKRNP